MDLTSDNVNVYQKFLSDYYHHNDNLKMASWGFSEDSKVLQDRTTVYYELETLK